jgi:SAM-dependent methyltransferase
MKPGNEIFAEGRRLRARQKRAQRRARDGGFMADLVADEFATRLAAINRRFGRVLDFGSIWNTFPPPLEASLADAAVTHIRIGETVDGLGEGHFDLALSAFGLHWAADMAQALAAIRSALKPDGLLLAVIPGHGTLEELRLSLLFAESNATGNAGMRVDRFPDIAQAGAILQGAGFALPVADVERLQLRYSSAARLVADMRDLGACSARRSLEPLPRGIGAKLEAAYRETCGDGNGRLKVTANLVYLTGWSPRDGRHESLAPGKGAPSGPE